MRIYEILIKFSVRLWEQRSQCFAFVNNINNETMDLVMNILYRLVKLSVLVAVLGTVVGCVSPVFDLGVRNPEPSGLKYENVASESSVISYMSSRDAAEVMGSGPLLTFNLKQNDAPLKEVEYLISNTEAELISRGIAVSFLPEGEGETTVTINSLKMVNHRVSGFSPLVTLTSLSADIEFEGKTHRVVSFVKRGKVPVWSLTEEPIVENVFNQPLAVLVQDFSSAINKNLFGYKVSDSDANALIADVRAGMLQNQVDYLAVYKLGFSNNLKVEPLLVELIGSDDEYVRLAAVSSLGALKSESSLGLLQNLYSTSKLWQDRGMALKAIGNIGTEEALKFIDEERKKIESSDVKSKEQIWNADILSLFL